MLITDELLDKLAERLALKHVLSGAELPRSAASRWQKPGLAAVALGVSPSTLKTHRQSGLFRMGTHYQILNGTKYKRGQPLPQYTHYVYDVEACAKLMGLTS